MDFQLDTNNKEFQDALQLITHTRQSVFLTGKAGTGKSTFLKYICNHTKKKYVVLAPTGIAAINAGGVTLHSFFKLPFRPMLPDDPDLSLSHGRIFEFFKYPKEKRKIITSVDRDDVEDLGASHSVKVIRAMHTLLSGIHLNCWNYMKQTMTLTVATGILLHSLTPSQQEKVLRWTVVNL